MTADGGASDVCGSPPKKTTNQAPSEADSVGGSEEPRIPPTASHRGSGFDACVSGSGDDTPIVIARLPEPSAASLIRTGSTRPISP